jgi:hypothetical protein
MGIVSLSRSKMANFEGIQSFSRPKSEGFKATQFLASNRFIASKRRVLKRQCHKTFVFRFFFINHGNLLPASCGKFSTCVVVTSRKCSLPLVSTTPVANLPLVTMTITAATLPHLSITLAVKSLCCPLECLVYSSLCCPPCWN